MLDVPICHFSCINKIISLFIGRGTENQVRVQKDFKQQATIQNEIPDDNKILKVLNWLTGWKMYWKSWRSRTS